MIDPVRLPDVSRLIELALAEDLGRGDVTSACVLDGDGGPAAAAVVAREPLVISGVRVAREVFRRVDRAITVKVRLPDGTQVEPGGVLMDVDGPAASILAAERTALNFLQRLSGVATLSRRFADAVADTSCTIVDTRKTTPGWRVLEKAAVVHGGCRNHRADLGSGVLIKDNHIAACGSVKSAVERARRRAPHSLRVEVEVTSMAELEEAIAARADLVLLDNMSVDQVQEAAARAHGAGLLVEVSGGVNLQRAPLYARAGADIISVGALTHSARAVDVALDFV
ncbi:MAG TPA: carboxylating nicotinate-nucleotide diphosphorylase [Kofleriaceae bacterium]|nr:carboxylating nicotinate-nucleotide diphosphorylase [Kofleriaceae bacterium]